MKIKFLFLAMVTVVVGCQSATSNDATSGKDSVEAAHDLPLFAANTEQPPEAIMKAGEQVFAATCKHCHVDSIGSGAPNVGLLASMSPRVILATLNSGKMQQQAAKLSPEEREAVAQFITSAVLKDNAVPEDVYVPFSIPDGYDQRFDQSGWGGNSEGTGFRTAEQAGITATNVGTLKLKWAFAFPDASQVRCKPALIDRWLITGSQLGDVYAIDTETGKPGWHFTANTAIRGAIQISKTPDGITAYFADYNTSVYALDVKAGKLLWTTRAGYHPQSGTTGSVALYNNMVFVPITSFEVVSAKDPNYDCCSTSGGVVALDATSGKILWTYKVIAEQAKPTGKKKNGKTFYGPSGAPVWCSPTIDPKTGLLYIGTGENYTYPATNSSDAVQAIDMKTGKLVWSFQGTQADTWNLACPGDPNCPDAVGPDLDFGMAPILVHNPDGTDMLVVGEKSGVVFGLSTAGKLLWKRRIGKGGALGGIHWGMATDGKYVYAANADNIYAIDGRDSLVNPSPGIYALDIHTGKQAWSAPTPACDTSVKGCIQANSAVPTVIPGVVFAGALDGHIRAYSAKDGKILWDYNTVKSFETSNGIKGHGGALDGSGPIVANGKLFVNSGYGMFGEMPGNVLLAFEIDPSK